MLQKPHQKLNEQLRKNADALKKFKEEQARKTSGLILLISMATSACSAAENQMGQLNLVALIAGQPAMQQIDWQMDGKTLDDTRHQISMNITVGNHSVCIAKTTLCRDFSIMTGKTTSLTFNLDKPNDS